MWSVNQNQVNQRMGGFLRIWSSLLLLLLCSILLVGTACAEEHTVVRVGFDGRVRDTADGSEPYGYGYDSYQKLADYTGWEYEYVYTGFSDIMEKLESGEIDVYLELTYSEEREKFLYYSTIPQGTAKYYLMTSQDNAELETIADISGKRVGVLRGSFAEKAFREYIKEHHIPCQVIPYDKDEDALENMEQNVIDAVFSFPNNVIGNTDVRLKFVGPSLVSNPFYFVVSRRRPDLYRELEVALQKLEVNEPGVLMELYNRYATESSEVPEDARGWLEEHDQLRVGYVQTQEPYLIVDEQGKAAGVYEELLERMTDRYGLSLEMKAFSDMEAMSQALSSGEIDAFAPAMEDNRFAEKYHLALTDIITSSSYRLFYVDHSDVERATIAISTTVPLQNDILKSRYPDAVFIVFPTVKECFDAVKRGVADCTFTTDAFYTYDYIRHMDMYDQLNMVQFDALKYELGLGVNRGNVGLLSLLNHDVANLDASLLQSSMIQNTYYQESLSISRLIRRNPVQAIWTGILIIASLLLLFYLYARSTRKTRRAQERAILAEQNANQAKTKFLSNMSHDIRTPMNAIVGYTAIATAHIDDRARVSDCLSKIAQASDHLQGLINDVLDMSRIESGKEKLNISKTSLPEMVRAVIPMVQSQLEWKHLELFIDTIDLKNELVYADTQKMRQVLINIIGNAVKFTDNGGSIGIRIRQQKVCKREGYGAYVLTVKDTGKGMSPEFVKHVFEPFSQERSEDRGQFSGTGLGMSITKNFVEMMGGSISVKSELGKGTEFSIHLEFKLQEDEKPDARLEKLRGFRVLVVDDDFDTCNSVTHMLQDVGMRADWSTSSKDALRRAEIAHNDGDGFFAYIIDWVMPITNGIELTRKIRQIVGPEVPIVILTAYSWAEVEEEAKAAGVTALCTKPLFVSDLTQVFLDNIMDVSDEKKKEAEASEIHFDGQRVLLAEDNKLNQEIARFQLEEMGLRVTSVMDGQQAVETMMGCSDGFFDFILMDIRMPIMNGIEATQQIRAAERPYLKEVPIIALTANAFTDDVEACLKAGMNEHMTKPFEAEQLGRVLRKYVKQKR